MDQHYSLLRIFVNCGRKKFYNTRPSWFPELTVSFSPLFPNRRLSYKLPAREWSSRRWSVPTPPGTNAKKLFYSSSRSGAKTFSYTTILIMTLSIVTLSIMTLSIMTLSIMTLSIMTLSINDTQHRGTEHDETQQNDIYSDTWHFDTQYYDT